MRRIKYQIMTEVNLGTADDPDIRQNIRGKSLPYTEANYQLALSEAYNGEVTIEDDGQPEPEPEPEPEPTLEDRVSTLETSKADQTSVDELNEALNMILTGVTE